MVSRKPLGSTTSEVARLASVNSKAGVYRRRHAVRGLSLKLARAGIYTRWSSILASQARLASMASTRTQRRHRHWR
jgi:hypothetical protein